MLVVVFLRGGADGISLLAPVADEGYQAARPTLAVEPAESLPIDAGFALHRELSSLAERFTNGSVAIVPAVGIPGLSRSHFDAQYRVEAAGSAQGADDGTGWLGRHLSLTSSTRSTTGAPNALRGVCFGQAGLPHLLAGSEEVIAAASLSALRLGGGAAVLPDVLDGALREMWANTPSPMASHAQAGFEAIDTAATLTDDSRDQRSRAGTDHGVTDTITVASAALGTEVAVINLGGWDTHDNQGTNEGSFAGLAGELDDALSALRAGLPDATVVVLSEFGRRIAENSSGGSDHGRGGLAIVEGPGVSGGIKGDWPGLSDHDDGDLRVLNDIRDLMAEVTGAVLGTDPARVVPEAPGGPLGLFW